MGSDRPFKQQKASAEAEAVVVVQTRLRQETVLLQGLYFLLDPFTFSTSASTPTVVLTLRYTSHSRCSAILCLRD